MSEIIVNKLQLKILNSIVNEMYSILNDPYVTIALLLIYICMHVLP